MVRKVLFGVFSLFAFGACMRPPDDADLVKYMVVQTTYDTAQVKESFNVFNTYNTFYIRLDTMGYVLNYPNADTILIDPVGNGVEFVSPVVEAVTDAFETVEFQRVEENETPDFAVKVAVLQNFSYYQTISNAYYGGYYGYYGYYYPVVSTYYSNTATLLIEVVDVANYVANGGKYVVVWRAYIGDLIKTDNLTVRTIEAVNRAFEQSPYISKN